MFSPCKVAILALSIAGIAAPLAAQDLQALSRDIGGIERGFWTRSVENDIHIDDDQLVIRRTYNTVVEWIEHGVPGRTVTDQLEWRLPIEHLVSVDVVSAPGGDLLEGGDQDSYCPLTVARFKCSSEQGDCGSYPIFVVCRYNSANLVKMLTALQARAPKMMITMAE
ncbi:hypothetical protein KBY27_12395 [Ruegeria pomeroyi]|uniref:Uncharacterized protein n=1 Tax=Ruegeria pomeroyi TaxID=89184 RepID=A0A9Q3WMN5_9RHOB|nr:hypothetical protein [Ruegeria pomeroyi]MCE8538252.1 hypothetical protein [Ruegeria pomeroyi]